MRPARQRLNAHQAARGKFHDRLIVQLEFVALQGATQIRFQLQRLQGSRVQSRVEDVVRAALQGFGAVHGRVSVAEQVLGLFVAAIAQNNANPDADQDLALPQEEGRREQALHLLDDAKRLAGIGAIAQQDRELVAAEASERAVRSEGALQALGDRQQQFVAKGVPEGVVDQFEAIAVEKQQGKRPLRLARSTVKRLSQAIEEISRWL